MSSRPLNYAVWPGTPVTVFTFCHLTILNRTGGNPVAHLHVLHNLILILSQTITQFCLKIQMFFSEQSSTCLSSACIYTASEVIRALDENKDPCNDFYEFACGGWIRNNPIPEGKSNWGIFSKIELHNQLIIRYALGMYFLNHITYFSPRIWPCKRGVKVIYT